MSPAVSVNKGCCNRQASSLYSPEGTQDGDKHAVHLQVNSLQLSPAMYPEGTQDGEKQEPGPR